LCERGWIHFEDRDFREARLHTGFIDEFLARTRPPEPPEEFTMIAALAATAASGASGQPLADARGSDLSHDRKGVVSRDRGTNGWLEAGREDLLR
jgi:hypothetical protein